MTSWRLAGYTVRSLTLERGVATMIPMGHTVTRFTLVARVLGSQD